MAKKKQKWTNGDVFIIRLKDNSVVNGQILDLQMKNVVRCALFNERSKSKTTLNNSCKLENLISLIATTREQLDFGVWEIIGSKEIAIDKNEFPNESFREVNWVGSKIYDASIVEEFADAFFALTPWNDWADPNYLDKLLCKIELKPDNLLLIKAN